MNTKTLILLPSMLLTLFSGPVWAAQFTTSFSYQGHLVDGGTPANGSYDIQFTLYDVATNGSAVTGPMTNNATAVTNGSFLVLLDFGAGAFQGADRWLEIGVRTNGGSTDFTILNPRQALTPTPYALYSPSAGTAMVASAVSPGIVTGAGIQNATITSDKVANGQFVKSINGLSDAVTLSAGANVILSTIGDTLQVSATGGNGSGWALTGNSAITGANFLGTTDNQAIELRAFNQRVFRLEPNGAGPFSSPNLIGGFSGNSVVPGSSGNTIGGGGAAGYINRDSGSFGTIGGGLGNTIETNIYEATIAGGNQNRIDSGAYRSSIGGGFLNHVIANTSTIGGGEANTSSANFGFIGGGQHNFASGPAATISGGEYNTASDYDAVVGGGDNNVASGINSTIAGGNNNGAGLLASVGGGGHNNAEGNSSTIGGGLGNYAPGEYATIAGGTNNTASGLYSTVAGGSANLAASPHVVISGGNQNTVFAGASTVGGGQLNRIAASAVNAVIGGGFNNHINTTGISATIPGGSGNTASGFGSFAAGTDAHANHDGSFVWGDGGGPASSGGPNRFDVRATGGVGFFVTGGSVTIDSAGTLTTKVLTITGGADVAEPFQMSPGHIPEGAVVVIDEEQPGRLKLSERSYDRRVAGIVSGANGIKPGISLSQQGVIEGGQNVALSGRVYVLADASSGAIKPGDLLTTSNTPGHAMRVGDPTRAQGAILGKAMSGLKQGKNIVLVLVTLQ